MIKFKKSKTMASILMALTILVAVPTMASAHCDTMDGPTVADGKKAIESNNVNYVLKWVTPENEKEISEIFDLSMKTKDLSPEAKEISENYFFENLIRLHRTAEGAPFTGLKPSGTAIDEKVLAADKSIEVGNLSPIENLVEKDKVPELKERFEKVMDLKDYDINDVEAGREYIEAYVSYFKFAEGEEEGHEAHGAEVSHSTEAASLEKSHDEAETLPVIPWSLAGVFGLTTVVLGIAYHKKASK
ncbi:peptidoglycan-binding protein [Clostridium beijerinckii]|nr:peptidoglycan-binding protein [Clostridium beijerinckii]